MSFPLAIVDAYVRSTLECGSSSYRLASSPHAHLPNESKAEGGSCCSRTPKRFALSHRRMGDDAHGYLVGGGPHRLSQGGGFLGCDPAGRARDTDRRHGNSSPIQDGCGNAAESQYAFFVVHGVTGLADRGKLPRQLDGGGQGVRGERLEAQRMSEPFALFGRLERQQCLTQSRAVQDGPRTGIADQAKIMRALEAIDIDYIQAVEDRQVDRFLGDPPELPDRLPSEFPERGLHVVVTPQAQELRPQAVSAFFIAPEIFFSLQMSEKAEGRALVDSCLGADFVQRYGGAGVLKQINDAKRLGQNANGFGFSRSEHGSPLRELPILFYRIKHAKQLRKTGLSLECVFRMLKRLEKSLDRRPDYTSTGNFTIRNIKKFCLTKRLVKFNTAMSQDRSLSLAR